MRFYAERPGRMAVQLLSDLAAITWLAAFAWLAGQARSAVLELGAPGHRMVEAGGGLRSTFADAASTASGVPFVGDDLAGALQRGGSSGDVLVDAGARVLEAVDLAATSAAVVIVALALVPVLAVWLPRRIRYARAAGQAVAMRAQGPDLLALRALAELPPRRLARIGTEPAAAWRAGDAEVIAQLAELRLASLGLRVS
ncbi:hypothetical protein EIL87_07040 [Saccharopolyspora rhizosphaerae]|uniref:Transmembrane protein n=1 Tax=Saccharopolyspora rhizosphaerae TaxID=2492662 RepID=A0A426JXY3_9PSEU|nr:hypothetical protein [Saccharopolyspora rhizosphaerae]RRO18016.1 hypothetical protein EIL87_07040 [Saccharopolyspora rhizosphaerae]